MSILPIRKLGKTAIREHRHKHFMLGDSGVERI